MGLTACEQHKNPLIEKDFVTKTAMLGYAGLGIPVKECADYYMGETKAANDIKNKCDKWTERYYKQSVGNSVPFTATLEDFRDPKFWEEVNAHYFEF